MNLPISAIKSLELSGVHYTSLNLDLTESDSPTVVMQSTIAKKQHVILVVLEDSIGKMQCALTQDCFIDLTLLCETLGRNLKGIEQVSITKLVHSFGLETMCGLPGLTNYPCIVSPQIMQADQLYFESGKSGALIKLDKKNIQLLFQGAQQIPFAKNIEQHMPPSANAITDDEASITKAVESFTSLRIKQRLETTLEIPPMPETSRKVIQLRVDPDAGVTELAALVETDPSLAAQVVSWASSPFYAAPGKIKSVHDAVIRVLGFDLVINLALGLSLGKGLELPNDGASNVTPYWKQAVYCATTTELICRQIPKEQRPAPGLAYLSGLLHNFGYLILGHIFPPHLSLVNRFLEANPHVPLQVIEYYLIGVTREQLASWLFNSWHMPDEIVTALRWQNSPRYKGEFHNYANILFIANQTLRSHNLGSGPAESIPPEMLEKLQIDPQELHLATQKIWDNIEHLDSIAKNLSNGT